MFGARLVACLLMVAMVARVCHSQSCLETESDRIYNQDFVSERAVSCMDQGTGVDLVAGSKCECARRTEEADLNTFRYSEDGCRAFQAVPVAVLVESRSGEEEETVELYVAAEPTGDTALPPDNGPTVTGLTYNIVGMAALVAQWDSVGDDHCRAVTGYSVEFGDAWNTVVTTDLTVTTPRTINLVCGDYNVTVTARDEDGSDYGTPAVAYADIPPAYELECCSPPFVMSAAGCVFPVVVCPMTFGDAREVCQSYGADLFISTSVEDTEDFANVVAELSADFPVTWVGAQKTGDNFAWSGGRPIDAADWRTVGIERKCPVPGPVDCVYLDARGNGPLCNSPCNEVLYFFCSAPTLSACVGSGAL